jgi:hypothetical protein
MEQEHKQAIDYWRSVARTARTDEQVAREHVREEWREEQTERYGQRRGFSQ